MLRTHTCGQLTKKEINQEVILCGWVHSRRDHGGIIFIDLRDRYGLTQIAFDPQVSKKAWQTADKVRSEWVIRVKGKVAARPKEMINPKIKTGQIEIKAQEIEILNKAKTPPFEIETEIKPSSIKEETRMKYRYLDLRQGRLQRNLVFRNQVVKFIREYLNEKGFLEIETPILSKSTPEGARDFLVPSRLQQGKFYALPQSPQQYKQLLMIAGFDKYFQIARCFRDEDMRQDRQPEFTQLDLEMSYIERDDILNLIEDLFTKLVEKLTSKKILFKPWPRLTYKEVKLKYGTDRPDLRFGLEIQDISDLVKESGFKVFEKALAEGGVVRAISVPEGAKLTRSVIDRLIDLAKNLGGQGLAYIVIKENSSFQSPIVKFLGEKLTQKIVQKLKAQTGDIIFFSADKENIVSSILGQVRSVLAEKLNLIPQDKLAFAFIIDFPLFEEELENGHFAPSHHMFTRPKDEDLDQLNKDPFKVKSYQYDWVGNGIELGGGSLRIHQRELQEKIFQLIGFSKEKQEKFKHLLEALEYGAPPHGGIAIGLERVLTLLLDEPSIREVMAFPKTGDGRDLMMETPSSVEEEQLKELGLKIVR